MEPVHGTTPQVAITTHAGLTSQEAEGRLAEQGPHELGRGERASPWK
jgi:hypothetical protein